MKSQRRPVGVTIIAILTVIGGILLVVGGLSLIALGSLISVTEYGTITSATNNSHPVAQVFGVISAAIGSVLLIIGIGYIMMFYGLLKERDGHGLSPLYCF